ncbi:MAG: Mobile element protein [Candidatus Carbobacillus altaicus]|uniref:Mobile element protein n=1 Tax=Candidatus Carbonibacillus altaicus TaxID=2163959 RepID=A0A2R6XXC3_9BACL|nr:MAG: Mobile element protein [Candidatus Carbobacillus altaicus]
MKEIVIGDGEARKRDVLVYNPKEVEKEKKHRDNFIVDLTKELECLRQLPDKQHTKAVCALHDYKVYGRYLRQLKGSQLRLNKQAISDAERDDGKYLIRT